jgi:hypothetical protein
MSGFIARVLSCFNVHVYSVFVDCLSRASVTCDRRIDSSFLLLLCRDNYSLYIVVTMRSQLPTVVLLYYRCKIDNKTRLFEYIVCILSFERLR